MLYGLCAGDARQAASLTSVAEELSAFMRSGGSPEQRGRAPASVDLLRAQLLAFGSELFERSQLELAPSLAALAGPLQADPVLQFVQVSASDLCRKLDIYNALLVL
jgi:hypothetical protein